MVNQAIAPRQSRNQGVEMLRIIAAYGIIWIHSNASGSEIAWAGLVVFLLMSPMMDVRHNWDKQRKPGRLLALLMVPWAFWTCAYGVKNVLSHVPFFRADPIWAGLLYGSSPHLWFLPFICGALMALNAMKGRVSPLHLAVASGTLAAALFATVSIWRPWSFTVGPPIQQWMHATPAVLVGVYLGLSARIGRTCSVFLGAIITGGLVVVTFAQVSAISVAYPIGIILTALAVYSGARLLSPLFNVQPIADCMLGVYLVHMLWLLAFQKITGPESHVAVAVTFFCSLISVWVARRYIPATHRVLG